MISRAALVYEERHFRELAVRGVQNALQTEAIKLRDDLRSLEERVILRADIVLEELWRRTEGAGARQATALQRLAGRVDDLELAGSVQAPELARLANQMAEVHRLATEVAEIRRSAEAGGGGAASGTIADELSRSLPAPVQRLEPYLKFFEVGPPVVDLAPGQSEFVRLATEAGLAASGLPSSSGDALEYLGSVEPGSLGGIFCPSLVDGLDLDTIGELLLLVAQALVPGGVAVIESANPASFTRYLSALRHPERPTPRFPEQLAAVAADAGLEVEECRYSPPPSRHLAGVSRDLADPALAEVADGINGLVAQLNELLYGPQDYALVLRRPPAQD